MIVSSVLNLFVSLLELVFGWINLPSFPDSLMSVINQLVDYITASISIMAVFVNMNTVRTLIPLVIAVVEFDKLWTLTMFILKKIPFVNIG